MEKIVAVLCVALALAADTGFPDFPVGYCKRHPSDPYCQPARPPRPTPTPPDGGTPAPKRS